MGVYGSYALNKADWGETSPACRAGLETDLGQVSPTSDLSFSRKCESLLERPNLARRKGDFRQMLSEANDDYFVDTLSWGDLNAAGLIHFTLHVEKLYADKALDF